MIRPHVFVLDTCAFRKYVEGNALDFLKSKIRSGLAWAVITPYTLYEFLAGSTNAEHYVSRRNELMNCEDFWVLNMNHILEFEGYEFGRDFLFSMGFFENTINHDYASAREILLSRMSDTLFKKFLFLAQLAACCYIFAHAESSPNFAPRKGQYMCNYIDECYADMHGARSKIIFDSLFKNDNLPTYNATMHEFFKPIKASNQSGTLLLEFMADAIAVAETEYAVAFQASIYNSINYYSFVANRFITWREELKNANNVKAVMKRYKQMHGGQNPIEKYCSMALKSMHRPLYRNAWTYLLTYCVFENGVIKPNISNDLIDMTNALVVDSLEIGTASFLTLDKRWVRFVRENCEDGHYAATIELWDKHDPVDIATYE